eukprot:SAG25_NODE_392_length_8604_cov_13.605879_5_plen_58_part_00
MCGSWLPLADFWGERGQNPRIPAVFRGWWESLGKLNFGSSRLDFRGVGGLRKYGLLS